MLVSEVEVAESSEELGGFQQPDGGSGFLWRSHPPAEEELGADVDERDRSLAVLLEDPAFALWATENAMRYHVSPVFMLGVLADLLEGEVRR